MEILLKVLLFSALVGGIGVAIFMWLNATDTEEDLSTYDENFDARKSIPRPNKEFVLASEDEEESREYAEALRAYQVPVTRRRSDSAESNSTTQGQGIKIKVRAPHQVQRQSYAAASFDKETVDAEIVEQDSSSIRNATSASDETPALESASTEEHAKK